jgi:hypothetical protein
MVRPFIHTQPPNVDELTGAMGIETALRILQMNKCWAKPPRTRIFEAKITVWKNVLQYCLLQRLRMYI